MASQPSLGTQDGDENRIARDGRPYTRNEFIEHYGEEWQVYWEQASIATAGGAPQPAAAAAGAPQPGAAAGTALTETQASVDNSATEGVQPKRLVTAEPDPLPWGSVLDIARCVRGTAAIELTLTCRGIRDLFLAERREELIHWVDRARAGRDWGPSWNTRTPRDPRGPATLPSTKGSRRQ